MPSFRSFSDELQKIAILSSVGNALRNELWSGQGRLGKFMTVAGGIGSAAEVAAAQDLRGEGRSRAERASALPGNIIGGALGSRYGGKLLGGKGVGGFIGNLAGGIGGSLVGERVTSFPWRHRRLARQQLAAASPQPATSPNPGVVA